jgi:transketolase
MINKPFSTVERPVNDIPETLRKCRRRLLQMHFESGVGHLGGNLSCLDALLTLHHQVLSSEDHFILAKGHSAGALYITLWSLGRLTDDELLTFHKDGTHLGGHPSPAWRQDIPFAAGSLGHGFPFACGLALGKALKEEAGRVFCLCSDGEWQEGSNWEALIFAAHHRLANLRLLVDWNGLQGFGTTQEVAGLGSLKSRFESFGIPTDEIDGHDPHALVQAFTNNAPGPRAILLKTVKGRGVSFMEDRMEWHYLPLSKEQYQQALQEQDQP